MRFLLFHSVDIGDPALQVRQCFETIEAALKNAGASLEDVVPTRMLLTRISDWEAIVKVRDEYFKTTRPVDTVVEVGSFITPDWLMEV